MQQVKRSSIFVGRKIKTVSGKMYDQLSYSEFVVKFFISWISMWIAWKYETTVLMPVMPLLNYSYSVIILCTNCGSISCYSWFFMYCLWQLVMWLLFCKFLCTLCGSWSSDRYSVNFYAPFLAAGYVNVIL